MAYMTQLDLEEYFGLSAAALDSESDLIGDLISRAQSRIDRLCNRTFEAGSDTTRYFDAVRDVDDADPRMLRLDKDLCQITTITNGDSVEVESDEYVTEDRNDTPWWAIRLLTSANKYWTYDTDPENAISIEGRWAYSITAPTDIQVACIRMVAWMYRQKDNMVDTRETIISGDGNVFLSNAVPFDVYQICMDYRRRE